jgi:hypothetical protein
MLDDKYEKYVHWDPSGTSIIIPNEKAVSYFGASRN